MPTFNTLVLKNMNGISRQITIIADDREKKSDVIGFLQKKDNVRISIKRLPTGDYLAANRILFERKTLNDFAISIIDGRLFKQAIRLAAAKYKSVFILEGSSKDLTIQGISRQALQGSLISISVILGIPVLRAMNAYETSNLILYTTQQALAASRGGLQRRSGYRPKNKMKRQIFILQGLPGIGPKKAKRLLDTFGNVEGVITASTEELQFVEGIGYNIAEKIKWAVREDSKTYGFTEDFPI